MQTTSDLMTEYWERAMDAFEVHEELQKNLADYQTIELSAWSFAKYKALYDLYSKINQRNKAEEQYG